MSTILFWWAVVVYGAAFGWEWRLRHRSGEGGDSGRWWLVASGVVAQVYSRGARLVAGEGQMMFNLATSLELVVLVLGILYLIGWRIRREEMGVAGYLLLPVMAGLLVLTLGLPEDRGPLREVRDLWLDVHLLLSLLVFGMMTIATLLALLAVSQERALRRKQFGHWTGWLPSIGALEEIVFAMVRVGFVLLTLAMVTGAFYSFRHHGVYWLFNHKVVFTWTAWVMYGVLLSGRAFWGWRGTRAARLVMGGYATLVLAFLGVKVVTELILQR